MSLLNHNLHYHKEKVGLLYMICRKNNIPYELYDIIKVEYKILISKLIEFKKLPKRSGGLMQLVCYGVADQLLSYGNRTQRLERFIGKPNNDTKNLNKRTYKHKNNHKYK